jgi:hypothetical protein
METLARKKYFFVVIALIATLTNTAWAQEAGNGAKAGLAFGYIVPDADDTNPRKISGVTGMADLTPAFSFGGYYLLSPSEDGTGGRDFAVSIHGLAAMYNLVGNRGTTFFGVRAGLSKVRTENSGVKLIFSPYHYGIAAGYDYYVLSRLTFGFEGNFLRYKESNTTEGGTKYIEPSFNTVSFLIALKLAL